MADIETLTEAEHAFVQKQAPNYVWEKLVRIHDAQAARIAELEQRAPVRVWVAFVGEFADRRTLGVFTSEEAAEAASRDHYEQRARQWEELNAPDLAAGARRETPDVEVWETSGAVSHG